jgi:hypothetical protein
MSICNLPEVLKVSYLLLFIPIYWLLSQRIYYRKIKSEGGCVGLYGYLGMIRIVILTIHAHRVFSVERKIMASLREERETTRSFITGLIGLIIVLMLFLI